MGNINIIQFNKKSASLNINFSGSNAVYIYYEGNFLFPKDLARLIYQSSYDKKEDLKVEVYDDAPVIFNKENSVVNNLNKLKYNQPKVATNLEKINNKFKFRKLIKLSSKSNKIQSVIFHIEVVSSEIKNEIKLNNLF